MTEPAPPDPPHRLLFLHGLFRQRYPNTGRTVADLLAQGLAHGVVSAQPDLLLDDGGRCPRYLVKPADDQATWHPLEVVEVVYDDIIRGRDAGHTLITRALRGLGALAANSPRLLRLVLPGRPRLSARQVGTAVLMALVFLLVVAVILAVTIPIIYGAVNYLITLLDWAGAEPAGPDAAPSGTLAGSIALLALLAALVKLFVSRRGAAIAKDATSTMYAILEYQKAGSGLRAQLLERVESAYRAVTGAGADRSLSIIAFSQGSLLAIDSLFPPGPTAVETSAARPRIDLLVTLGCPLAIATRLWPDRPKRRCQASVGRWINLYESQDQLGGAVAELIADQGIETALEDRRFTYAAAPGQAAESPHFTYWKDGAADQRPSVTQIAGELLAEDEAAPAAS